MSLLAILVGCAMADGHLKWVDHSVTDLVPELKNEGFALVTLKHLLQMTSGIDYAENDFPFGVRISCSCLLTVVNRGTPTPR